MKRTMIGAVLGLTVGGPLGPAYAQEAAQVVGYSVTASSREATLSFTLTDGSALEMALRGGSVFIDGETVGRYAAGGSLETAWRALLSQSSALSTDQMVAAARAWKPEVPTGPGAGSLAALRDRILTLQPMEEVTAPTLAAREEVTAALAEAAEAISEAEVASQAALVIRNELRSALREQFRGRTATAGRSRGRSFSVNVGGRAANFGSSPGEAIWEGMLGLLGAFLALGGIAFGASFFAPRQLDVMADTVSASFGRSFFVGLFAQPLILPVFAMMLVGLTLTIVGVIVIPVAIVAFLVALAAAVVGGYLSVARVAGAGWLKRKNQDFAIEGLPTWKSVAYGLAIVLAIWLPAILLGWAPVVGTVLKWTAAIVTWGLATTGFGAAILTRGGLYGTFGRKFAPPVVAPDRLFEPSETRLTTAEWMAGRTR